MYLELFKGQTRWYWHLRAKNKQIVLVSQGYFSKYNAKRAAKKLSESNGIELRLE